jgi:hypothetical protein
VAHHLLVVVFLGVTLNAGDQALVTLLDSRMAGTAGSGIAALFEMALRTGILVMGLQLFMGEVLCLDTLIVAFATAYSRIRAEQAMMTCSTALGGLLVCTVIEQHGAATVFEIVSLAFTLRSRGTETDSCSGCSEGKDQSYGEGQITTPTGVTTHGCPAE